MMIEETTATAAGTRSFIWPPDCRKTYFYSSARDSLDASRNSRDLDAGRVGPDPTPSLSIVAANSSRSPEVRVSVAASIQPSTCAGDLAPTIAPVTPGHVRVHATATADTLVLCRSAIGFSASRSAMFFSSHGVWKFGALLRQSSSAIFFTRSAENVSVRMPDCMGL